MSEMVERVEKALREAAVPHEGDTRSLSYYASAGIDHFRHDHDRLAALISIAARAAIEAMREPTLAMERCPLYCRDEDAAMWRAMIDAALKDPE